MAREPSLHMVNVGSIVKLSEEYFEEWPTVRDYARQSMQETIFKVMSQITTRPLAKGTLFTLKAIAGQLVGKPNETICRAEKDLQVLSPEEIEKFMNKYRNEAYYGRNL